MPPGETLARVAHLPVQIPGGLEGRRVKWILLAVVLLALLIGSGVFGIDWWTDRSYVGTSKRVTLAWTCWNDIFWTDPHRDAHWWAGDSPAPTGPLETQAPTTGADSALPQRHATGKLVFNSLHKATFRSDAGGTLAMTRESKRAPHTTACAVGTSNPGVAPKR